LIEIIDGTVYFENGTKYPLSPKEMRAVESYCSLLVVGKQMTNLTGGNRP